RGLRSALLKVTATPHSVAPEPLEELPALDVRLEREVLVGAQPEAHSARHEDLRSEGDRRVSASLGSEYAGRGAGASIRTALRGFLFLAEEVDEALGELGRDVV